MPKKRNVMYTTISFSFLYVKTMLEIYGVLPTVISAVLQKHDHRIISTEKTFHKPPCGICQTHLSANNPCNCTHCF